jgi:asparagine synthase (glutamine-hydrolysing)
VCGIYGIAGFSGGGGSRIGERSLPALLAAMGEALVHRGPDDEGVWLSQDRHVSVGIGMRRLSIIDVTGGRQPILNEDESVIVVCNGEIYNYRELRDELVSKGHQFRTMSDTEVLVHLYEEHGWECVSRLRGMFAFALWDAREQVLVLARDRVGIKPLFFRCDRERIVFASEVRGLLQAFDQGPEVDRSALFRLLVLQYVPGPGTAISSVRKLMPGTVLLMSERGIETHTYWRPPTICWSQGSWTDADVQQAILEHLQEAVASHLVSDVPIGAFLSGGVDSAALVALMNRAGASDFNTFSVGFDGPPQFTELSYARQVAARFGTAHHELVIGPKDLTDSLRQIVRHLDEPLTDPAIVPTYLLSQLAARRVKVVLTGEGADELFGGYQRYALDRLFAWYRLVPAGLRYALLRWLRKSSVNRRVVQGASALSEKSPSRRHISWIGTFTHEELMQVSADPMEAAGEEQEIERLFQTYFEDGGEPEAALEGMLRADLATWLPDDLLTKVDRMAMAASLEARVPYLDHPLVELVSSMPVTLKIRNGVRKAVLKAAVADLVPPAILRRRKMGFEMPLVSWFRGPLREFVTDLLSLEGPPGLFNEKAIAEFLRQHLREEQDRSRQLWAFLLVKLWYQVVIRERPAVVR